MNINDADLNSIKALWALLRDQNVSKAARSLGLTQPAMSNALSRLRVLFNDQLLVRVGKNMELTPKARELYPQLEPIVLLVSQLFLQSISFDPKAIHTSFKLAVSDYSSFIVVPKIIAHFGREFPKVTILTTRLGVDSYGHDLQNNRIDFIISTGFRKDLPPQVHSRILHHEIFACAVSRKSKLKKMTFEDYVSMEHIGVSPSGLDVSVIDQELKKLNEKRSISYEVPHFSVACTILEDSSAVATLPRGILKNMEDRFKIKTFQLPFELPNFDVSLVWHELHHKSIRHQWFRQEIYKAIGDISII